MEPRWKGKAAKAKAFADPMSKIVLELQSSLVQSEAQALLAGCSALLAVESEQIDLLNRACFGRLLVTTEKEKQWFQLSMEEAFYLCHSLKCLKINVGEDNCPKNDEELWEYMKSKKEKFPLFYKAYSHLRNKNWVVRSGSQYGVDFVAYCHHPSLVHSQYAVLVLSGDDVDDANHRLREWSDIHCTIRLCGSVAKTLLVLYINKNDQGTVSPSCLEGYAVQERTIMRWSPQQCREDQAAVENGIK